MVDYSLPVSELAELRATHRRTRDKREADRIKAVVLLASGRGYPGHVDTRDRPRLPTIPRQNT